MKPQYRLEKAFLLGKTLVGDFYDNPNWEDGYEIRTSKILNDISEINVGDVVETLNSKYLIGSMEKDNSIWNT